LLAEKKTDSSDGYKFNLGSDAVKDDDFESF